MYYYAAYIDDTGPEQTVTKFYQAYFVRDFDTVSQNLSVFWAVRFLPQYGDMTPAQLLENRAAIEKDLSEVLAEGEKDTVIPENMTVAVKKEYTKEGKNSAVVVYEIKENGKTTNTEAAVLIRENDKMRILEMVPVFPQSLEQIKQIDTNALDENFANLIGTEE